MSKLQTAMAAIDAANEQDPNRTEGSPDALLYGQRMTLEQIRIFPDASDALQLAARGQHIERWTLKRSDYPEGRTGYLTWRRELADHHAKRVGEIMQDTGYGPDEIDAAGRMLRKQGIKRDPQVQALEDIICLVFLKWYFAPFAAKHSAEKIESIVQKTARKMSQDARMRVLDEFDLPQNLASAFAE